MEFEVGKYYKTRDGQKMLYIGCNPLCRKEPQVFSDYDGYIITRKDDGSHVNSTKKSNDNDIVGEWEEPKKRIQGWVNLYSNGKIGTTVFHEKAHAAYFPYHRDKIIARFYIDVEEGEGL